MEVHFFSKCSKCLFAAFLTIIVWFLIFENGLESITAITPFSQEDLSSLSEEHQSLDHQNVQVEPEPVSQYHPSPDHQENHVEIEEVSQKHSNPDQKENLAEINDSVGYIESGSKIAVIIETRIHGSLVPLLLHFAAVLGPSWPVILYTSPEMLSFLSNSSALTRQQSHGQIIVRLLNDSPKFTDWSSISHFMTVPEFWEGLAPAENILYFQRDSILCSNSVRSVEDFFEFDFVGAPVDPDGGWGSPENGRLHYNGGLSLRKRSSLLRVLQEFEYKDGGPEDQWFVNRMIDLQEEGRGNFTFPSIEIAKTFSVETIEYSRPLGYHQPLRFLKSEEHKQSVEKWCPEHKLLIDGHEWIGG